MRRTGDGTCSHDAIEARGRAHGVSGGAARWRWTTIQDYPTTSEWPGKSHACLTGMKRLALGRHLTSCSVLYALPDTAAVANAKIRNDSNHPCRHQRTFPSEGLPAQLRRFQAGQSIVLALPALASQTAAPSTGAQLWSTGDASSSSRPAFPLRRRASPRPEL
ncbi:hypothetical protein ACCO45_009512 [Purpureocillium lilacinum]|uniref:Uncharacterized protein n=2 Tax=Purpureocillium lilacinum TaxID=33203 RepID=A0ACC4DMJ9_PURLI|nr:hypothetical protein Purlil1_3526 [Purpureocillium lilacinum]